MRKLIKQKEKTIIVDENTEKYSLSIYHFNLQYKAGDKKSYFSLVPASFTPFVRFFDEHPRWKANLELQGHFIGFLARHFPEDLKLLTKLNQRDQIEIVNVHYSDQIYLAYPYRDMIESCKLNKEIFDKYGLRRSEVFFAQENFFGEGAEKYMRENGYSIALLNQHYYSHHHLNVPLAPYYRYKSIDALIKGVHGVVNEDQKYQIFQTFSYWDDGELAFASGNNYVPWYGPSEIAYANHVRKYKKLEKNGFKIVRVSDYINRVKELKLKPIELKPITDGSWNMQYYGGVYLWMGTHRLPWERDGDIRSYTYQARGILLGTEKLMEWFEFQGNPITHNMKINLKMAWKHLLLAEVSDSTGQTPVLIEVHYSMNELNECIKCCEKIYNEINKKCIEKHIDLPQDIYIDTTQEGKNIILLQGYPSYLGILNTLDQDALNKFQFIDYAKLKAFIEGDINLLRVRKHSVHFNQYSAPLPDSINKNKNEHLIFDIEWHPNYTKFISRVMSFMRVQKYTTFTPLFDRRFGNYSGIIFPLHEKKLIYCPALMENEPREYNLDEFDFGRTWLGLPNGLIGLGNNIYIIKHNSFGNTHIAATINRDNQFPVKGNTVSFMTLNPPRCTYYWRFSLFKGTLNDAVELANKINVYPVVKLDYSRISL